MSFDISERDWGWIAGFMEGEGSFGFYDRGPRCQAGQKQRHPLDKIMRLIGGNIYTDKNGFHRWYAVGQRAVEIMMLLHPLMSPRRQEQISFALAEWAKLPKQAKTGPFDPNRKTKQPEYNSNRLKEWHDKYRDTPEYKAKNIERIRQWRERQKSKPPLFSFD